MNIIATIIALLIVIAGAVYIRQLPKSEVQKLQKDTNQIAEQDVELDQEELELPQPTRTEIPTPIPTKKPSASSDTNQSPTEIQYPNAVQIRTEGNTTVYESQDDPDAITDWYKEKIKELGMSATSFVTTKTNGNVLNELVGANGKREIRVEITKSADQSTTEIKLTITQE